IPTKLQPKVVPPVDVTPAAGAAGDVGAAAPFAAAGGQGGELPDVLTEKHKLIRNRYLEKSPQSRHVPVAVTLIVDQDHVDRVLTSFTNSKLRFLTSQVLLNRYPLTVAPDLRQYELLRQQREAAKKLKGIAGPVGGELAPAPIPSLVPDVGGGDLRGGTASTAATVSEDLE